MLARRSAFVAVVGLVLTVAVLAGPAGAAPTGTVPRPKPYTESVTDKVIAVGSTVVAVSPVGRAFTVVRWLMGAASAYSAGQALLTAINGYEDGDTGSYWDPEDRTPWGSNVPQTEDPTLGSCRMQNLKWTVQTPGGKVPSGANNPLTDRSGIVGSWSNLPSAEVVRDIEASSTDSYTTTNNVCTSDPDGSGPAQPSPTGKVGYVYFCSAGPDPAGPMYASASTGLPIPVSGSNSTLYANHSVFGVACPAGGSLVYFRWAQFPSTDSTATHFPGSGQWVAPGFDLDRLLTYRVEVDCRAEDGTVTTVSNGYAPDGDGVAQTVVPTCPLGSVPIETRLYTDDPTGSGTSGGAPELVGRERVDVDTIREKYPECAPGGCELQVFIDGAKCTVGADRCWNWWETAQTTPDRVRCQWGPYTMPLRDCEPQRFIYRTGEVAPDPRTGERVAASPTTGRPDPAAGPTVATDPNVDPDPDAPPVPEPAPNPDPSGDPPVDPTPDNPDDPLPDPDGDTGNCWAGMASWNPIDWVVTPVKCALVWAFVPRPDVLADQLTDLSDVGPGPWVAAAGDLVEATAITGPGACAGPAWNLGATAVTDATTLYPFWACGGPQATIAGVVRVGLTVLVWLGAGVVSIRLVGSAFGLNLNGFGGRDEDT